MITLERRITVALEYLRETMDETERTQNLQDNAYYLGYYRGIRLAVVGLEDALEHYKRDSEAENGKG